MSRSECQGWTAWAARENRKFLQRIDFAAMLGLGYVLVSASLTVRDIPEDAGAFKSVLDDFLTDCRRRGLVAHHWVLEWQRRGAPHLHLALAWARVPDEVVRVEGFPPVTVTAGERVSRTVRERWLHHSRAWGTCDRGQHVVEMNHARGWALYLAKHAARSVQEAQAALPEGLRSGAARRIEPDQRDNALMPASWQTSGRVWGRSRNGWVLEENEIEASPEERRQVKRLQRRWEISRARVQLGRVQDLLNRGPLRAKTRDRLERREQVAVHILCAKRRFGRVNPSSQLYRDQLARAGGNRPQAHRWSQHLRQFTSDLPGPAVESYLAWFRALDQPAGGRLREVERVA